jgi:hypothetical protein
MFLGRARSARTWRRYFETFSRVKLVGVKCLTGILMKVFELGDEPN